MVVAGRGEELCVRDESGVWYESDTEGGVCGTSGATANCRRDHRHQHDAPAARPQSSSSRLSSRPEPHSAQGRHSHKAASKITLHETPSATAAVRTPAPLPAATSLPVTYEYGGRRSEGVLDITSVHSVASCLEAAIEMGERLMGVRAVCLPTRPAPVPRLAPGTPSGPCTRLAPVPA